MIKKLEGMLETVDYETNLPFLVHNNFDLADYPKHWHSAVEIIMPIQSAYKVIVNNIEYQMDESDILFIPAGHIHELFGKLVWGQRIFLQFDLSIFKTIIGLANSSYIFLKPCFITKNDYPDLHKKMQSLLLEVLEEDIQKNDYYEAKITSNIIDIAVHMARKHDERDVVANSADFLKRKDHITKFNYCIEYISNHYKEDLSLDLISHVVGYSKFHFTRWFKQFASISFFDYLTRVRINVAETMLLNSTIPVTEIAMEAGFQSITTFNRIFKDIKKCTPTEYRHYLKANQKKEEYRKKL